MSRRIAIAVLALALACDSAAPEDLPDLTGRYSLVSHTVKDVTRTPPRVSAVLVLSRQAVEHGRARGDSWMEMQRQGANGVSTGGSWTGGYAHSANGSMVMSQQGLPFEGDYALRGDTLITTLVPTVTGLSEQALYHSPRGKLVWVWDDAL